MYTYTQGAWSSADDIDLASFGFTDYIELTSRLGPIYYYSRDTTVAVFQHTFLGKLIILV